MSNQMVLDGEIVCLDDEGKPDFAALRLRRMTQSSKSLRFSIKRIRRVALTHHRSRRERYFDYGTWPAFLPALRHEFVRLETYDLAVHRLCHFGSHRLDCFGASL
jgi:hypothetical protein